MEYRLQGVCGERRQALWGNVRGGGVIAAFRALDIPEMEELTDLNALRGSLINIPYTLPSGQTVKLWDDDRIYLGSQLHKKGSGRCCGVAADETYLAVSEYGGNGEDAEIVVFKRWN